LKKQKYVIGAVAPKPPMPLTEAEVTRNWASSHEKPLVSILCACYNHESFIEDALNGFLMQRTDFPFEVIINDDASTDGSVEIINKYARLYPKIIKPILQTENQYGKGIKAFFFTSGEAKGKYFALCQGDDYWLDETKLQTQADFLEKHLEYSLCGHNAFVIEGGIVMSANVIPRWHQRDTVQKRLAERTNVTATLTTMFRRPVDLYPEEHSKIVQGDNFIFSRLGLIGSYKFMSDISPAARRHHSGGVWSMINPKLRLSQSSTSYFWMAQYFDRIGEQHLSIHFMQRAALRSLDGVRAMRLRELLKFGVLLINQLLLKRVKTGLPALYSILHNVRQNGLRKH
jgi:glycosyltransferase involved in cell wall biosynthesis